MRTYVPNVGTGATTQSIRYHVYHSVVRVFDLANAGKRGKKVEEIALYNIDMIPDSKTHDLLCSFIEAIESMTFDHVKQTMQDIVEMSKLEKAGRVEMESREVKGIRVAPAEFSKIEFENEHMSVEADWNTFTINDRSDTYNMPSCIPTSSQKTGPKKFYAWLKSNLDNAKKMTFSELNRAMMDVGILSHYYCRMD